MWQAYLHTVHILAFHSISSYLVYIIYFETTNHSWVINKLVPNPFIMLSESVTFSFSCFLLIEKKYFRLHCIMVQRYNTGEHNAFNEWWWMMNKQYFWINLRQIWEQRCVSAAQKHFRKLKYFHYLYILGHMRISHHISGYKEKVLKLFFLLSNVKMGQIGPWTVCKG